MISKQQLRIKRIFDFFLGMVLLPILIFPIVFFVILATIETGQFGVFVQKRVGQHGKPFRFYKIRTLKNELHQLGNLKKSAGVYGNFLRNAKLDELPQLFNVILGDMSFVGPRPDVKGFADLLKEDDRIILKVKPGITGAATLKYKDEEVILASQDHPEIYNRTVIWKDKVEINKAYIRNWSFSLDLKLLIKTLVNR